MAENADEDNGIDFVCSLCDNGGEVASCEGRCLRSFHAIKGSSEGCQTLGYSRLQFNAMKVFLCKNCEYETYQCFACGRLGSAKMNHPEVFKCAVETCGHFYHANCVAQLLFPENDDKVREYTAMIANGAKFACPIHRCDICKYGENKEVKDLQFAVCRRCPKSYHRRCLPREIAFEDLMDSGQFVFQRAWDELLPNNRILLYCMKHDIDPETRTALRNHIIFPTDPATVRKPLNQLSGIKKNIVKVLQTDEHPPAALSSVKRSGAGKHASLNDLMKKKRRLPVSGEKPAVVEKKAVIPKIPVSSFPEIDRNTEMRIYELSQTAAAHITIEDVKKRLAVPFTYTQNLQNADNITLEMVERSSEAVKAALHMLENGASIEEAKTVCTPGDLIQIVKWKNKLNIYLAPILHGARYTSYGRHFTKLDKLQLIVDKVQWYIQNGDTVVDFCCGSNDFSLLMKEKLEASGKQCFYKNYDLIQPKNDFCFERRDWMTVQPDELPPGCRLIMGLNPPFGFKASLANQFINKALTFKPKLIILIVPKETERLDRKYPPYELIWEDSDQLSGKSFYLPGSFDADYKVMDQWNVSPPALSLWSRSDWAKRHSEIARSKEHLPSENASYVDMQSEVTGHVEMSETIPATHMSHADKLFADTHNDATNSPGDFWTDTNSRSLQPCNYEAPGWFDPTQNHHSERRAESDMSMSSSDRADCQRPKHHLERRAESDMSISSSDRFDCERQDQSLSISEHGGAGPQACNAPKSAAAGKSTAPADCEEVTSACGPYHLPGDLPLPPSGVQYWMMEDSPPVEEPAVGFLSRKPRDPRPARRLAFAAQYQRMEDTPSTPTPEDP